ncbi:MAG: phage head closure protein [Rhizobiales bacterium]|mgnify:CR=1 FL=1|nr:phage head closure protein [Hyphomicrobiales bacterium]
MRAGKLDHVITIEAVSDGVPDAYGVSEPAWSAFATVRAQILQQTTDEYLRGYGEGSATVVSFRLRWIDGVTVKHRVIRTGVAFNIREIKEIGRRAGLELRCEEIRE